jgi:hypothetical protein
MSPDENKNYIHSGSMTIQKCQDRLFFEQEENNELGPSGARTKSNEFVNSLN